jgi:hypothetical protein
LFVQLYDAQKTDELRGLLPRNRIDHLTNVSLGFQGSSALHVTYNRHDERYLIFDDDESIVLDTEGVEKRHEKSASVLKWLWAVAANHDVGGYRVLHGYDSSGTVTLGLDANGVIVGQPLPWTRSGASQLTASLIYLPQRTPGPFAGKLLATSGRMQRYLNDDGSACFPPLPRLLSGTENGIAVANTVTGGFAYFSRGKELGLWMRVYLSNSDAF